MPDPDPRQLAYEAYRAAWQRDVWAALAQRIEDGIALAAQKKREQQQ